MSDIIPRLDALGLEAPKTREWLRWSDHTQDGEVAELLGELLTVIEGSDRVIEQAADTILMLIGMDEGPDELEKKPSPPGEQMKLDTTGSRLYFIPDGHSIHVPLSEQWDGVVADVGDVLRGVAMTGEQLVLAYRKLQAELETAHFVARGWREQFRRANRAKREAVEALKRTREQRDHAEECRIGEGIYTLWLEAELEQERGKRCATPPKPEGPANLHFYGSTEKPWPSQ